MVTTRVYCAAEPVFGTPTECASAASIVIPVFRYLKLAFVHPNTTPTRMQEESGVFIKPLEGFRLLLSKFRCTRTRHEKLHTLYTHVHVHRVIRTRIPAPLT